MVAKAQGEAARFNQLYAEYKRAPAVTRERLYLDAVQEVMQNSSKVMVDVEGGNNMMYLPLDQLRQSGSGSGSDASGVNTQQIVNDVIRELQQRTSNTNQRLR